MKETESTARQTQLSPTVEDQEVPPMTKETESTSRQTQLSPTVEDQVATGTAKILESPLISEGPGRIANSPVPSVFVRRKTLNSM
jgi:hypothetical protein